MCNCQYIMYSPCLERIAYLGGPVTNHGFVRLYF